MWLDSGTEHSEVSYLQLSEYCLPGSDPKLMTFVALVISLEPDLAMTRISYLSSGSSCCIVACRFARSSSEPALQRETPTDKYAKMNENNKRTTNLINGPAGSLNVVDGGRRSATDEQKTG